VTAAYSNFVVQTPKETTIILFASTTTQPQNLTILICNLSFGFTPVFKSDIISQSNNSLTCYRLNQCECETVCDGRTKIRKPQKSHWISTISFLSLGWLSANLHTFRCELALTMYRFKIKKPADIRSQSRRISAANIFITPYVPYCIIGYNDFNNWVRVTRG